MVAGRTDEDHNSRNGIVFVVSYVEQRFHRLDDELIFRIPDQVSSCFKTCANLGFHFDRFRYQRQHVRDINTRRAI